MFLQRALITLTVGPLALYLIYLGGLPYFLFITAVLIVATIEYALLMRLLGRTISLWVLFPAVAMLWVAGQWPTFTILTPALAFGLFLTMCYSLWLYERNKSNAVTVDWMVMIGGVILLGWIGSHFFLIRSMNTLAWQWTFLAMLGTWIADSAAYLVGKFLAGNILLGRHQLSPRLSPNKTIEGYIGGIIFAIIVTVWVGNMMGIPFLGTFILGFLVSAVSPLGDLAISLLKREAGVKDSGTLLCGHGGALDRIDSLVWSVTMGYYLALFLN
jgi:phosphatidate cytidylyltransferase